MKRLKDNWDAKYIYYDGERELLECGSSGTVSYRNVYGQGIDEILARKDSVDRGGETFYYQQDRNGNVTHITDASGIIRETYHYDAFGGHAMYNSGGGLITISNYANPWRFTGRRYQPTFGIYEYRARAYHPRLGRFTSEDPKLYDAGDYNLFRYCHNDPLDLTDPMGLEINWSGAGPQNPENHAALATLVELRNLRELTGAGGAISTGMLNYAIGQLQQAGSTMAQQTLRTAAPDKSKYAPGEPYSAERSVRNNYDRMIYPNGHIGRTADIDIWVFDRSHKPVAEGTAISELVPVGKKNTIDLVGGLPENQGFTRHTLRNGQMDAPDTWQHVFSSMQGTVTRVQTLQVGPNRLTWEATHSAKSGVEIFSTQTGYFSQPGTPGY